MNLLSALAALKRFDDRRDGFPGEHWAAFGTGLALVLSARSRPSAFGRVAARVLGGALIWRAATGRDGLARLVRPQSAPPRV